MPTKETSQETSTLTLLKEVSKDILVKCLTLFQLEWGVKNLMPDDTNHNFLDVSVGYSPLQVVYVFFDTATYDEIERDVKVNLELIF